MRYVPAFILVSVALWLAVPPPSALAEVLDAAPAGFTVENSGVVPVDAGAAWAALVGQVDAWWPKDHSWWGAEGRLSIEPRVDGCFCEVAGDRQAEQGQKCADPVGLQRVPHVAVDQQREAGRHAARRTRVLGQKVEGTRR